MFTLKFEFILKYLLDKRWGKPKGQSKMDNPETLATLSRQETDKKNTTKQKSKTISNTDPHQQSGMSPGAR
jgi:hypothetical protein